MADDYEQNDNKILVLIDTDHYYNVVSWRIKEFKDDLVTTEIRSNVWKDTCVQLKNYSVWKSLLKGKTFKNKFKISGN